MAANRSVSEISVFIVENCDIKSTRVSSVIRYLNTCKDQLERLTKLAILSLDSCIVSSLPVEFEK